MAEDTKQAQNEPVNDTQESAMPTEEQKTTEPKVSGQESEQKTEGEGLPDEAKERTKREFDKLQTQLREERTRREYYESVFQSLQPPKQEEIAPVIDPETGLPNEQVLTDVQRSAKQAEQRAERAEKAVQQYLSDQENRAVYQSHPELNPEGKEFNQDLHNLTRSFLLDSMVNPDAYGNKQLSFMEAAGKAKNILSGNVEEVKKQAAKEAMEQLTPKEQASLEAVGSGSRRVDMEGNLAELQKKTRRGDHQAIAARLKAALGEE